MTSASAILFAVVATGIVVFQVALALGAPWGAYAMGGRFPDRYPPTMRVAALGQAALLAALAVVVLSKAELATPSVVQALPSLIWLAVAFSAVSLVLNVITPSSRERKLWAPVAAVMLVSSLVVALTAS